MKKRLTKNDLYNNLYTCYIINMTLSARTKKKCPLSFCSFLVEPLDDLEKIVGESFSQIPNK